MKDNVTPRKEATSVRLEPKIKYLVEIAARVQRRSVTNYIEWALEESLKGLMIETDKSVLSVESELWDINKEERLKKLSALYPSLLTYEEEVLLSKSIEGIS